MYLILVDAYSKWPKIFKVKSANTYYKLEKLWEVFSRLGLPNTIVSDNWTPFTASEFSSFYSTNGIKHLTIPLGHPASNGAAENSVKSFKLRLKKNMCAFPDYSPAAALS